MPLGLVQCTAVKVELFSVLTNDTKVWKPERLLVCVLRGSGRSKNCASPSTGWKRERHLLLSFFSPVFFFFFSVLGLCVLQSIDVGANLQSRSQFKVHGVDHVLLGQQQQSLSVYFLGAKLLGRVLATWKREGENRERFSVACSFWRISCAGIYPLICE